MEHLGPAALDALLDCGDFKDWKALRDAIAADPFGTLSVTVMRLCAAHRMYGTSALWTTWIERVRRRHPVGLRELRRRRDLTQTEVARALESSQSDVSKLERRADVRVSSLRSYVSALGGRLEIRAVFEDGVATVDLRES